MAPNRNPLNSWGGDTGKTRGPCLAGVRRSCPGALEGHALCGAAQSGAVADAHEIATHAYDLDLPYRSAARRRHALRTEVAGDRLRLNEALFEAKALSLWLAAERNNHNLPGNSEAYGKPMAKTRGDIEIGVAAPIQSLQIGVRVDNRAAE
jgi:hypothetical protein